MRVNPLLIVLFLFAVFLNIDTCAAQGWVWGRVGTGGYSDAWSVTTDFVGNVYTAGVRTGAHGTPGVDFGGGIISPTGTGGGLSPAMWAKYDNAGNPIWAGGTLRGQTWLNNITTDPSGNLIVYGYFLSDTMQIGSFVLVNTFPVGDAQYYIAKISPGGTVLWAINDGNGSFQLGSSAGTLSNGWVTTDNAGNIYVTGSFYSTSIMIGPLTLFNSSATSNDVFLAKYTSSGALVWATTFGGTASDEGLSITVVPTGNVYVCGSFRSSSMTIGSSVLSTTHARGTGYIAEFSNAGLPLWAQIVDCKKGSFAVGVAHDNNSNVYITGAFFDTTASFGGIVVTRPIPIPIPYAALFLVKYTPAHTVAWGKSISSKDFDVWGFSIGVAACGEVWVSALQVDTAIIEGNIFPQVTDGYPANEVDPILISGYDINGNLVGYGGLASGGDDHNTVACDAKGNVFVSADNWKIRTVVGPDTLPKPPSLLSEYMYVAKYLNTSVPITDTAFMRTDTSLCTDDSVVLRAPAGYSFYYWSDGSSGSTLKVNPGTYWVCCVSCSDTTIIDTFHIKRVFHDPVIHTNELRLCFPPGKSITLYASKGNSYMWSDGSADSILIVASHGSYWVAATSGCDVIIDTFLVKPEIFDVAISAGDTICPGIPASIKITVTPNNLIPILNWVPSAGIADTTSLDTYFQSYLPGIYRYVLTAKNPSGCVDTDSVLFLIGQPVRITISPGNITIPYGKSVQLNAECYPLNNNVMKYYWSPDDGSIDNRNISNPIAKPNTTTTYTVVGMNMFGCRDTASEVIAIDYDYEALPTAFTPNGDGINDVFSLCNSSYTKLVDFSIYNRWGERVYHNTIDASKGWDGKYNSVPQEIGAYFYIIIVARPNGEEKVYKGDVTLLR